MIEPGKACTFMQFLDGCSDDGKDGQWCKVEIPIIQRDYAQGRPGAEMEQLRKRFLDSLFEALEVDNKKLVLDFVYGCVEKEDVNIFCPLDGQQRLTTLWLLHWYLAFRSGDMSIQESLKKFSYETRYSSRVFCDKLCGMLSVTPSAPESVAEYIRQSRWFFHSYRQDPTISGMLRMLGDIESRFKQTAGEQGGVVAQEYLEKLKDEAPITFYTTVLTRHGEGTEESSKSTELPLTDDLYIKMNARGKPLTPYENFKADLLAHLKSEGSKVDDLAQLLDGDVTELFWREFRSKQDCHIDEIMLVFFSRLFHCRYIAHARDAAKKQLMDTKALKEDNHYVSLCVPAGDRETEPMSYSGFDAYEKVFSLVVSCGRDLKTCLSNLVELFLDKPENEERLMALCPPWESKRDIPLIPQYKEDSGQNNIKVKQVTWKELSVFYGICLYLIYGRLAETERLRDWMCFVWNMAENCFATHANENHAINLIRFLGNIAPDAASDIETYLAGLFNAKKLNGSLPDSWDALADVLGHQEQAAVRQLHEEVFKAHVIKLGRIPKNDIRETEKIAFFKGAIAFLMMDGEGCLTADKGLFETKRKAAESIFDANDLKAEDKLNKLSVFYSWCSNNQLIRGGHIFDALKTTWRDNICLRVLGKDYLFAEPLHALLVGWNRNAKMEDYAAFLSPCEMVKSFLFSERSGCSLRGGYDYCLKLYPNRKPDEGVFLDKIGRERDKQIAEWLEDGKVKLCVPDVAVRIGETFHCIWGRNVDITYGSGSDEIRLRWRILRGGDPGVDWQNARHRFYLLGVGGKADIYVDRWDVSLEEIVRELKEKTAGKT